MLVLSRKEQEVITIGDEIRVIIVKISGNIVRVGVEAPQHIKVMREELERTHTCDSMEPGETKSAANEQPGSGTNPAQSSGHG